MNGKGSDQRVSCSRVVTLLKLINQKFIELVASFPVIEMKLRERYEV